MNIIFNIVNLVPNFGTHSLQVAFLASEIAKNLNLDSKKAFFSGYIHDIGVLVPHQDFVLDDINSSYLLTNDVQSANELTNLHTVFGSFIIGQFDFLRDLSGIILKHHAVSKLLDEQNEIDVYANIIAISEEISKYHFINKEVEYEDLFLPIMSIKNRFFKKVFNAAIDVIKREFTLWVLDDIKRGIIKERIISDYISNNLKMIDEEEHLVDLGILVSFIVDAKSEFTKEHSWRVSTVAKEMAKIAGLNEKDLFIAGLYHDVGKIKTPHKILEKKGKLAEKEMNIMKQHVYYSYVILSDYKDEPWFNPAVRHQERIDGSGYPLKLKKEQMTLEDEILQVADYYSALLEDRPYRKGFSSEKAFEITFETGKNGLLSMEAIDILSETLKGKEFKKIEYISDVQKRIDHFVRGISK